MKKLHTLLLALLPVAAMAQELPNDSQPLKIGVNAGATFAGIRGNDVAEQNDYAFDYLVGFTLEAPISNNLSFITGLNYERLSYTRFIPFDNVSPDPVDDPAFLDGGFDARFTMHYLTLPVNLKHYVGVAKRFYINGGFFAGYYLDGSLHIDGDKVDDNSDAAVFKDFNFGANLGVGVRFPFNETSDINIELRDNLGLVNISDVPVVGNGTVKTNSVNLIVAWQFAF
jgi:hypothetical protein